MQNAKRVSTTLKSNEMTLSEAAKRYGVQKHMLADAVGKGTLRGRLRTATYRAAHRSPIWVVTQEAMREFLEEAAIKEEENKQKTKLPLQARTTEEDRLALLKRRRLEDLQDAKRLGISYEDYRKIMHL